MPSRSEKSFGSRLDNARKMLIHIQSFPTYNPGVEDLGTASFLTLLDAATQQNMDAAGNAQAYSSAVDTRQQLFKKGSGSLPVMLTSIVSVVRASYDKKSKQAAEIKTMVVKIIGAGGKKKDKEASADSISQSERGYGNVTKTFSDLIATLERYGAKYNPGNAAITLPALYLKLAELAQANTNVTTTLGALKQIRDSRVSLYTKLSAIAQRIKEAVKSQYGTKSIEFKLIKGLTV